MSFQSRSGSSFFTISGSSIPIQPMSRGRVICPAYWGAIRASTRFQDRQMESTESHRVPSRSNNSPSNKKKRLPLKYIL